MTSTTFSPKAGGFCQVFRSSFRQIRGVALLYTALLTVTFPLLLTLSLAQVSAAPYSLMEERSRRAMDYLNGALYFALPAFLWTFTIVFAVSLFHYLQNKRSVDLYHALPIRRETMLLGRVCAAFASLAVPFVVLFLLSLVIAAYSAYRCSGLMFPKPGVPWARCSPSCCSPCSTRLPSSAWCLLPGVLRHGIRRSGERHRLCGGLPCSCCCARNMCTSRWPGSAPTTSR